MSFESEAKALRESGLPKKLASWNLIVVQTGSEEYYCFSHGDMLLAYPGIQGFGSFIHGYQDAREEPTALEEFNEKILQDVMILGLGEKIGLVRKYPMQKPVAMEDTTQAEALCHALLAAKPQFDQYPTLEDWFKANSLSKEENRWAPKVGEDGSIGICDTTKLTVTMDWAVAKISDKSVVNQLVQKRQEETVVKIITFACPIPHAQKYPMAQILFDGTKHTPIDAFLVDDYDKEHANFASRFLSYCSQAGVPKAVVCLDERAFYLYREIVAELGVKIALAKGSDKEMDAVCEGLVHAIAESVQGEHHCCHHHDHEEGHECCHHHDHEEGHECCHHHDHEEGHECCHHHDHEEGHECCHHHDHEEGHECCHHHDHEEGHECCHHHE